MNRHVWQPIVMYSLTAEACAHCGVPKTPNDRIKLEIQQQVAEEFKDRPGVQFWTLTTRSCQLYQQRLKLP